MPTQRVKQNLLTCMAAMCRSSGDMSCASADDTCEYLLALDLSDLFFTIRIAMTTTAIAPVRPADGREQRQSARGRWSVQQPTVRVRQSDELLTAGDSNSGSRRHPDSGSGVIRADCRLDLGIDLVFLQTVHLRNRVLSL